MEYYHILWIVGGILIASGAAAHGRTFYNSTALEYNNQVMTLPRGLLARLFGFSPKPYFKDNDPSRNVCSTFSSEHRG